ncbi:helix-turn-helix domain-containing protein [Duganella phyllosphaerae]|uniref:HTH cro/C1-type domain-containing protein n=1 Tax=Duganella phyllosphaerae TaxID=762836 RepID=A0A1E7WGU5_9BURK|nr:helix-turn-helix domain-containing protein [Duganella phyllosphaerae]OEZ97670.1 hypothetical protein DUPY_35030 [Duganella phyllosphaerae]
MSMTKKLPLSDEELEAFEADRDVGAELLQAGREMQAGLDRVVYSPLIAAREKTGLTREQFAGLLGMHASELEKLEQNRNRLDGAVRTLVAVALSHPDALVKAVRAGSPRRLTSLLSSARSWRQAP